MEDTVAPYAGAWIEIVFIHMFIVCPTSLLMQERGLKSKDILYQLAKDVVAPYAGAWIEIINYVFLTLSLVVAPYAGAWIEISLLITLFHSFIVAPYAGAWIEIISAVDGT